MNIQNLSLHIALTASTITATGLGIIALGLWLNYKEKWEKCEQYAKTILDYRGSLEHKGKLIDELYDERRELRRQLGEATERLAKIQAVFEPEGQAK